MNQDRTPRQLSTTRIFSRTTSTVPSQLRPFLANHKLIIPATLDHRLDQSSLQIYHGPVKVSQTTLNIQDLLQDHRLWSKPIKTFPGLIHIPTSPGHQHAPSTFIPYPPWATQSFPEPSWSTKSTTKPPTLLQIHSNLSGLPHVCRSHSKPSLSLTHYWTSRNL